ncbi:MAG TPA: 4'-phosphopantetheinyl transferase superfamily protein [Candidatus Eisenbacteria bacterium]|nr:4'-phosphopantetheinyl transferase superfamily protein [Candidatus Eisenbacteria bacterium]
MIGDDVVDFADEETAVGTRHPRFDARVFDPSERALLGMSREPERLRWILWAAKESAYKAARKEVPATVFSPSCFVVEPEAGGDVTVHAAGRRFRVELRGDGDHVHAVAHSAGAAGRTCAAVARIDAGASPSAAARRLAIARLAPVLGVAPERLAIHRHGRVPALWIDGAPAAADLSLAHHGRFVSFACALPARDA